MHRRLWPAFLMRIYALDLSGNYPGGANPTSPLQPVRVVVIVTLAPSKKYEFVWGDGIPYRNENTVIQSSKSTSASEIPIEHRCIFSENNIFLHNSEDFF